jgi:hypothetical protein
MRFSERIYRLLLKIYPEAYRLRYEQPMAQLFSDQLRAADTRGKLVVLWLRTLVDLARSVPARHADRPPLPLSRLDPVTPLPLVPWSATARRSIFFAREEASAFGSRVITVEHLLAGILRGEQELPELGPRRDELLRELEAGETRPRRNPPAEDLPISGVLRGVLSVAKDEASRAGASHCTPRHLIAAILQQETAAAKLMRRHGIGSERFRP